MLLGLRTAAIVNESLSKAACKVLQAALLAFMDDSLCFLVVVVA